MGTLTRGLTFGSTETVTNTKLHNLVDNGSVSDIVNADIDASAGIVDTKLDTITTGSKVSGLALFGLGSIPSGGGIIDVKNGGTGLATITDGGLLIGSGTSAVTAMAALADGSIVIGDSGTDPVSLAAFTSSSGTLKHERGGIEADISSVAKGGLVVGTGSGSMGLKTVGNNGQILQADSSEGGGVKWAAGMAIAAQVSPSAANTTSDMSITTDKRYMLFISLTPDSVDTSFSLQFNNTTSTHDGLTNTTDSTGSSVGTSTGADIDIATVDSAGSITGTIFIDTNTDLDKHVIVHGHLMFTDPTNGLAMVNVVGSYNNNAPTSVEIESGGNNFSGDVILYDLGSY